MDREQVAGILAEIGTLLELQGESSFRVNAYHNGARAILQMEGDLAEMVRTNRLTEVAGIGDTLREKITTLMTTGRLPFYDDLKAKTPPGLVEILRVPGLGPKKVIALHKELGIDTLEKLRIACEAGQVAGLKGFGKRTQEKILEGLESLRQMAGRVRLDQALAVADTIVAALRELPGVQQIEVCGSIRRRKETIKDIDVLIAGVGDTGPLMERFVSLPGVVQITGQGDTRSSVVIKKLLPSGSQITMNADLRVVSPEQFPFALHYFTGSKEHGIAMRIRAQRYGLKLNEYGLEGESKHVRARSEADIFRALDLAYIPPEMREDTGEMDLAASDGLPPLIEVDDIQGVFHNHTTYSDGANTLEEMALAAQHLGLKYLGIGDHSQSLTIANGLSPARVRQQHREIDALNKRLKGIHLFKGTECDILLDGSLDYDEELLTSFDYVVASVHTHFQLPREQQTERIIRAIRHPLVTMLGHSTGRLLLRREGYQVDLEAILEAAAASGCMIEINADPHRLDLDWVHCKRARAMGVTLVINPDAHSTHGLANFVHGVEVARRGWLEKQHVFNTRPLAEVSRYFAERKQAAAGE
ncbi:MAG: DNA polymerase/3'-5' exonuclease PolX [Gemmataceae bacterium]